MLKKTDLFDKWLSGLKDKKGRAIIISRITRLSSGNLGDVKWFSGIGELRIPYGPGYRVYFMQENNEIIILLCGGDKSSQSRDIKRAIAIMKDIRR